MDEASPFGRTRPVEYLIAVLGYAVAAIVLLFPVFTRGSEEIYSPALHLTRPMASWVMWILAWDVHALTTGQALFDANIFHPAPDSLAFGDPLLGLVPFFAPAYLVTGNTVLSYQLTVLTTLTMCGASMFYLARHWGVGIVPAALAGLVYAFCPTRIGLLAELAHLSGQFLPLALIFIDRLRIRPKAWDALLLTLFAAWQLHCGTQLAYASLLVLTVYAVAGALVRGEGWSLRGWLLSLAAIGGGVAALWVSTRPYRALLADRMFEGGSMYDLASFASADAWRMYLVPPYASKLAADGTHYVGLVAVFLTSIGIIRAFVGKRGILVQLTAVAVLCYWMSLGLGVGGGDLALYRYALDFVPGFAMLGPAPSRFVMFLMIPVAGFAALGADRLQTFAGSRRVLGWGALAILFAAVLVDYRLPFQGFDTRRVLLDRDEMPIYATLAELPPGPVLELPMQPCAVGAFSATIDRQLASTLHWKPLLDGYRSHYRAPPTHDVIRAMSNGLPDERVLELIRRATGLRYVVVHLTDLPGHWRRRWRSVEGMTRLGFFGNDLLFELADRGEGDLREALLGLSRSDRTLTGLPVSKLDETGRVARLAFSKLPPRAARMGERVRAEVLVENRSDVTWPALTPDSEGRIYVSYLWADAEGDLAGGNAQAQALPLDLAPGESVVVPVCARVPRVTGDLGLSFGITQADEWFPQYSERIAVSVIP